MLVPIGTAFGYGTRTHRLSRTPPGREASRCAVRPQAARRERAWTRLEGDSRALGAESTFPSGRVDPWHRSSRPVQRASRPLGSRESESLRGDSTPHARSSGRAGGRLAHPTRPSPFGESPSAAVDSPPRVGPRRGRIRPPPLPVSPPLPLQALPMPAFHCRLEPVVVFPKRPVADLHEKTPLLYTTGCG